MSLRVGQMRHLVLAICAMGALSTCAQPTASGIYLGGGENHLYMLQIVEAPDHQISGSFETIAFDRNGQVDTMSAPITGSIDGADLTLSNVPRWYEGRFNMSGKVTSRAIDLSYLSGEAVATFTLRRSSLEDYSRQADELRERARALVEQQQAVAYRRTLQELCAELEQTAANDVRAIAVISEAPARYRALSDQMATIARNTSLESYERRYALTEIEHNARSLRYEVNALRDQFEGHRVDVIQRTSQGLEWCGQRKDPICQRLSRASQEYNRQADGLASALAVAASSFEAESSRQEQLMASE